MYAEFVKKFSSQNIPNSAPKPIQDIQRKIQVLNSILNEISCTLVELKNNQNDLNLIADSFFSFTRNTFVNSTKSCQNITPIKLSADALERIPKNILDKKSKAISKATPKAPTKKTTLKKIQTKQTKTTSRPITRSNTRVKTVDYAKEICSESSKETIGSEYTETKKPKRRLAIDENLVFDQEEVEWSVSESFKAFANSLLQ